MCAQEDGVVTAFQTDRGSEVRPSAPEASDDSLRSRVLVVDDEPKDCLALADLLRSRGYEVATARNAFRGLDLLGRFRPEVVLTELRLAGLDGLTFLQRVRSLSPVTRLVIHTAHGSVNDAVHAMKSGADDFLEKPVDEEVLCDALRRAVERASLRSRIHSARRDGAGDAASLGVIGDHPSMRAALKRAEQVAPSRATVLITGESGTGKGLMAETIHRLSDRSEGPFVEVSCAALSESLLGSELFGHERGAFTGAGSRREGRFMTAKGGTLFLDEIGSYPMDTQVKLLRFLQTRQFERVGGNETLTVDVRLIAATNSDLRAAVAEGRFREDLYYRLNVVRLELPPLRQRRKDVVPLAEMFLERFAGENQRRLDGFTADALDRLMAYSWPGNVRELEHAVEHAAIMAQGRRVTVGDLPEAILSSSSDPFDVPIPGSTLAEIERAAILKSLMAVGGKVKDASDMLGISKSKIYYRLREYGYEE